MFTTSSEGRLLQIDFQLTLYRGSSAKTSDSLLKNQIKYESSQFEIVDQPGTWSDQP